MKIAEENIYYDKLKNSKITNSINNILINTNIVKVSYEQKEFTESIPKHGLE